MAGLAAFAAVPAWAGGEGHRRLAEAARGLAPNGLRVLAPHGSEANLNVIAQLFHDLSGVEVTIETTGIQDVAKDMMLRHMAGGAQWDVGLPACPELPDLIAAGVIRPLPDQPLRDPADRAIFTHADFFDGRRYGYLTDGDQQVLFLNRDILEDDRLTKSWEDRTGTPFDLPTSWAGLDARMAHVTEPGDDRWGAILNRRPGFVETEFWLRLLAKGVWPLDPDLEPQIASDPGIEVLADMVATMPHIADAQVGPGSLAANARRFETGRILGFLSYGGLQKVLNRRGAPLAGRLAFINPPGGGAPNLPTDLPAMTWGWSYSVPSGSANAEAAMLFSAFAVSDAPSTQAIRVAQGFFDPFLESHYKDEEVISVYGGDFLDWHRDAMQRAIPEFMVAGRGDYKASLGRWISLALTGEVTPRNALENAATDWRLINGTLDRDLQISRWRANRAAFPDAVGRHLRDIPALRSNEG